MRSSTTRHNDYDAAQNPAVPLSVYKELAAQLQAAQTRLNSLNAENQVLAQQNQQLRQEVENAVQSMLHLQQRVRATSPYNDQASSNFVNAAAVDNRYTASQSRSTQRSTKANRTSSLPSKSGKSSKQYTEQEHGKYQRRVSSASAAEMNGWGLAIAILMIVVSAFGTGYFIVRPLLSGR